MNLKLLLVVILCLEYWCLEGISACDSENRFLLLSCNNWSFCVGNHHGCWIERSAEFVLLFLSGKDKIPGFDVTLRSMLSCVSVFFHLCFCFSILMLHLDVVGVLFWKHSV